MKLYTEEEVRKMLEQMSIETERKNLGVSANFRHREIEIKKLINLQTPIQLPSDEEIKKMMEVDGMEFDEFDPYDVSYLGGATWMRNKIQGNKE